MLFSVVIPTYLRPESLERCLRSFSLQVFSKTDFEVIVSNNSPEIIVEPLIKRFRILGVNISSIDESRHGAHFARNSGVNAAKGKYIIFTDDDCEADTFLLTNYRAAISEFKPIIAAGGIDIDWDSPPPHWIIPFESLMGKIDFGLGVFWLQKGQAANGGNLLIERDFFLKIGGMHTDQVGKLTLGSGDIALSFTANRFGHNVLWVGNARVRHHQNREENAKFRDLLRREFNNGIVRIYEMRKHNCRGMFLRVLYTTAHMILFSGYQFVKGILFFNLSFIARSFLTLGGILGMYWFLTFMNRSFQQGGEQL